MKLEVPVLRRWAKVLTVIAGAGLAASCGGSGTGTEPQLPPTISSITPNAGVQGTAVPVTVAGANFSAGVTTVAVTGTGITATGVTLAGSTALAATLVIASDATLGAHAVTVTTSAGTATSPTFTVNPPPPTLTAVAPNTGVQGSTVSVTLLGAHFVSGAGTTTVSVAGSGVTVGPVTVVSGSQLTADFQIAAGATLGDHAVSVTTSGGTSTSQPFAVTALPPTLTAIAPDSGAQGATVPVTLTGSGFVSGGSTIIVSGSGVTASNMTVTSPTTITASFVITPGAQLGAHDVTVTTAAGTTAPRPFTVVSPPPTLAGIAPDTALRGQSVSVTLTGTNFLASGTSVNVGGTGVAVANVQVTSGTSLTATFVIDTTSATVGDHAVSVTTFGGGTTAALPFTVTAVPIISIFNANPTTVTAGNSTTLTWYGIRYAATCSINNGVGDVTCVNTSIQVAPAASTTYILTVTGPGGTATATARVTVVP